MRRSEAMRQAMRQAVDGAARVVIEALEGRWMLAAGDPDPTFGGGDGFVSVAYTGFAFTHDIGAGMLVQPDGKIVIAGRSHSGGNTNDRVALARLNPDGSLDATFGGGTGKVLMQVDPDADANAIALTPDGKIVVAGTTTHGVTQVWDWFLARFNADGSVDDTFGGGDGFVTRDFGFNFGDSIHAVSVQGDGRIVVTGVSTQSTSQLATARFEEDGDLDPTFSGDGFDIQDMFGGVDYASDVIIDPDGKIVVVGGSVPPQPPPGEPREHRRVIMLRYGSDGVLDPTFGTSGRVSTDFGFSAFGRQVIRDPGGNYVVGGLVSGVGQEMRYMVARYDSTGTLDPTFGTNASLPGTTIFENIHAFEFKNLGIALQDDGRIVFGGNAESLADHQTFMGLVRLTETGQPDPTFGVDGARMYSAPGYSVGFSDGADVAIASDGGILLFGDAWANNNTDLALFKLIAEGDVTPPPVQLVGTELQVTGTEGNDALKLTSDGETFTATLNETIYTFPSAGVQRILVDLMGGHDSEIHETGVPGGMVILGDGDDSLYLGTANKGTGPELDVFGGNGNDDVVLDVAFFTPTNFTGGAGTDWLTYNGSQGDDTLNIHDNRIDDDGFFPATYATVERVKVLANFGFDTVNIRSLRNVTLYEVDGGAGDDLFEISNAAVPDSFAAATTITGGDGDDDIFFNDPTNTFADTYTVTPTSFTRQGMGIFSYQTAELLRIAGGSGGNPFNVTPSANTEYSFEGNNPAIAPGDSITVNLTGALEADFELLGAGRGRYTFSNRQPVSYIEIERDLTSYGPKVKTAVFNYNLEQSVELAFTEETTDIGLTDLVVKNLTTGQTMPAGMFVLTTSGGPGIGTTAKWKANEVLPDGQYEARLPANSVRDKDGNHLATEFVINFAVMAGDANRDGRVSTADFLRIDRGYGRGSSGFVNGDFDYNGVIDGGDFFIIDEAFLAQQSAPPAAMPAAMPAASPGVPLATAMQPAAPAPVQPVVEEEGAADDGSAVFASGDDDVLA